MSFLVFAGLTDLQGEPQSTTGPMLKRELAIIKGPKTKEVLEKKGKAWSCSPTSWEYSPPLASLEDQGLASLQESQEPLLSAGLA